jgi:hypothetical protein
MLENGHWNPQYEMFPEVLYDGHGNYAQIHEQPDGRTLYIWYDSTGKQVDAWWIGPVPGEEIADGS